ncbi:Crp/Fnr family transcriptional regulator [Sphingomonas sp. 179-I 2A4 NHS]|jgi:CRP-like cAMP-binding protein
MHEGLQSPASTAAPMSSRVSLAGTRIGASPLLSREERQALEGAALTSRSVSTGQDLMREGEAADRLHVIVDGWACRYLTTRDGARQISALLVPGDTVNLDVLAFGRSGYGVRALTAAKVLAIPRERALALAAQHAGIVRTFALLAFTENAIVSQWTLCIGRLSARQRLAHLLCELSVRLEGSEGDESSFGLPVTQEQLADVLGLTSVHVNRTIQQLRTEGLIVTGNCTITIPNVSRLRAAGEFDPAYLHIPPVNHE